MNKPIIEQSSIYHARAIKDPDIMNIKPGYDFAYPILNTIDVINVFITEETAIIDIERMGKTKWEFDKATSKLTIEKKSKTETHTIIDIEELAQTMLEFYHQHRDVINNHIKETNNRKSISKLGNQNAIKDKENDPTTTSEQSNRQEDKSPEGTGIFNQYGSQTIKDKEIHSDKVAYKTPEELGDIGDWEGDHEDYFRIIDNNDWWELIDDEHRRIGKRHRNSFEAEIYGRKPRDY